MDAYDGGTGDGQVLGGGLIDDSRLDLDRSRLANRPERSAKAGLTRRRIPSD